MSQSLFTHHPQMQEQVLHFTNLSTKRREQKKSDKPNDIAGKRSSFLEGYLWPTPQKETSLRHMYRHSTNEPGYRVSNPGVCKFFFT